MEQRANAFATYLMLPPSGIKKLAPRTNTTEQLVRDVMRRYGAGFEMTLNTLYNLKEINHQQEVFLKEQSNKPHLPYDHPDVVPREDIGIDRGPLLEVVQRGLEQGTIRPASARRLLDLSITDPIPSDGYEPTPAWAAPMITEEEQRFRRARALLFAHTGAHMILIKTLRRVDEGWHVEALVDDAPRIFSLSPALDAASNG
jgi:hypothetical protein